MQIIRAGERFRTEHDGIVSWHVFSAGPHYDPQRVGAGALVALDVHELDPAAGFAEHAHRGVTIVSLVLDGVLRHTGADGRRTVRAGELLVQHTGDGVRHAEYNASTEFPLRLLQMALLSPAPAGVRAGRLPLRLGRAELRLADGADPLPADASVTAAFVIEGTATLAGERLHAGDTVIDAGPDGLSVHGRSVVWLGW